MSADNNDFRLKKSVAERAMEQEPRASFPCLQWGGCAIRAGGLRGLLLHTTAQLGSGGGNVGRSTFCRTAPPAGRLFHTLGCQ